MVPPPRTRSSNDYHRMLNNNVAIFLAALGIASLAACSPPTIRARGIQPLNLNAVQESTPVDVRFYQLLDDNAFITTPFETLWTDAPKALGGTLAGEPVVRTVFPGTLGDPPVTLTLSNREQRVRWLGVLALYRGSEKAPRQLVIPIDDLGDGVLELTGYSVRFNTGAEANPAGEAKPAESKGDNPPANQEPKPAPTPRGGKR